MQINQMPEHVRPREKLLRLGAACLTDAELLAIFFRTGIKGLNAIELAQHLLQSQGSIQGLFSLNCDDFCQQKGLGPAKYVQLQAVLELSKRFFKEELQREAVLDSSTAVANYLKCQLQLQKKECFYLLLLDSQNRLIKSINLFQGSINSSPVYPREVVSTVIENNAANVICAHNHPSGIAKPSDADLLITSRLSEALSLIDVRIIDHIVIGSGQTYSFADHGLI